MSEKEGEKRNLFIDFEKLCELLEIPFEEKVKVLNPIIREILKEFAQKRLRLSINRELEKEFWDFEAECYLQVKRIDSRDRFWRLWHPIPTLKEDDLFGFELIKDELSAFAVCKKEPDLAYLLTGQNSLADGQKLVILLLSLDKDELEITLLDAEE